LDPTISRPDVVILAGDISTGDRAVNWAAETFPGIPVLYVAGNHEFYGNTIQAVEADLAAACQASKSVRFLNRNEVILDGIRFLGCPLWTDFTLFGIDKRQAAMLAAEKSMLDYERIRIIRHGHYAKLRAADTRRLHAEQRAWLAHALSAPFPGKTVVITHMAPSMRSVAERYASDPVSAGFASNLDDLAEKADLWVHGHMHGSFDYETNGCRVVCNPLGYPKRNQIREFLGAENPAFDANFIVEI
jgi:predicted phosphohydrolase